MNIKVNEVLSILNSTEIKSFISFVSSDFHNKNEKLKRLAIKICYNSNLSEYDQFATMYPGESFVRQKIYDAYSQLGRLLRDFLVFQTILKNEAKMNMECLIALSSITASKSFESMSAVVKDKLDRSLIKGEQFFKDKYEFERVQDKEFMSRESRSQDLSLQQKDDNLDRFYFLSKLKSACEMYNRQNIVNQPFESLFIKEIEEFLEKPSTRILSRSLTTQVYFEILKMVRDRNELAYEELVKMLGDKITEISVDELKDIYNYAQNFCIFQANNGNIIYLEKLFELYVLQIDNGVILRGGIISEWDYKTVITVGLRMKKHNWTEKFISNFKDKLSEDVRENAFAFNLANFYYEIEEYRKALRTLSGVDFTDVYYNLGSRSLLLKIYFEQEDDIAIDSHMISFGYFLKRNKLISVYQRNVHLNLIRFTKNVSQLRYIKPKKINLEFREKILKLRMRVDSAKEINNLTWLKKRVDDLLIFD